MDFGIIIIGAFMIFLYVGFALILNRSRASRKKQFVNDLYLLAKQNNCQINEHDLWHYTIIGIDKDAHKLFFIRHTTNHQASIEINLPEIEKCQLVNIFRNGDNKSTLDKTFDKLELVFTYRERKYPDKVLEFYKNEYDSPKLHREFQLIQKWSAIVEDQLKQLSKKSN